MTFWFFALGLPLAACGAFAVACSSLAAKALVAFPRNNIAGMVLIVLSIITMETVVAEKENDAKVKVAEQEMYKYLS